MEAENELNERKKRNENKRIGRIDAFKNVTCHRLRFHTLAHTHTLIQPFMAMNPYKIYL